MSEGTDVVARLSTAAAWAFDDNRMQLAGACLDGATEITRLREALEKIVHDPFGTEAEETHNETYEEPFDCVRRFQAIARAALSPTQKGEA